MDGTHQLDLGRIKGNVAKMVDMGAPEADIDNYLSHEGTTPDAIRAVQLPNNDARETQPISTLKDVGLSAAGVPQELAARAVGMPGDLAALGRKADDLSPVSGLADRAGEYLAEKLTGKPAQGGPIAQVNPLPTTQQVKQGVNDATGMDGFYKPQTAAGGVVQEGVVGALMGLPAGGAAAVSGLSSGVAGEGARRAFEGTALETPASVVAALAGGGLPSAARMAGAVSRPGDILARSLENVTPEQLTQAQTLMDDARKMGVQLTGPEAIQQVVGGQTRLGTLQRQVEQAPTGEAQLRPVMMARPGQVQAAGEGLLNDTFGATQAPEVAANNAQKAGETLVTNAVRGRTDATQPDFAAARTGALPANDPRLQELQDLKNQVDSEIKLTGPNNALGQKLQKFRSLLDTTPDATGSHGIGPLVETNRTYAENLYKQYNPLDPENTFNNREVAALAPHNKKLQDILESASPDYARGLTNYKALSPDVNALEQGPAGRIANETGADPGSRVKSMADEFLDPNTARPAHINKLAADLGSIDPNAVPHLIGARLTNIFNNSVKELQSGPNPWGGAKFVTETMGNPQSRANLEATIKAMPNGAKVWPGWVKFSEVMKATGKRLPRGSDTAVNLGIGDELKNATGLLQRTATGPLSVAKGALEDYAARANASTLGKIFADPQAVDKMRQLAILNPASRKAQALVGEILAITGSQNRGEDLQDTNKQQGIGQ